MTRPLRFTTRRAERGNVFAMLFGAVALTGVLAAVSMQTLTGPVTTITRVTQRNVAENNLLMNGKILINAAVAGVSGGDADADGIIEPAPFIAPGGGEAAPSNGGFLPTDLGLALTDPWGTKYGYCVWDHGTTNTSANRITGDNTASASTQPVIAIIAAGPDKTFQTSCPAWSGGPVTVSKAAGSDDLIEHYTYAEATASSNGLWSLNASDQAKAELKDSGGTVNVTIDRSTGIGDFLGITTDTLAAKTSNVTLDGGLKLDTETNVTACAAADAGVIRYNAASGKLEVCNGTAWRAAGSDLWLENGTHIYSGNTGNVGIGTNAPTQKLDVVGNTAVSGNSTIGGTLGVTGATALGDTISVAGAATLSSTLAVTGAATLSSTLDVTGNTTIDSGTLIVDAANNRVGVGTATPGEALDVVSATRPLIRVMGPSSVNKNIYLTDSTNDRRWAISQDTSNRFGLGYFNGASWLSPEPFKIDPSGNVGIGTETPSYLLDVNGMARIAGAATLSNTLSVAGNTAIDIDTLFVDVAANTVGIGTTTPAARLDVTGGVKIGADAVCNASKAGMVAWNANQFQVCDGTAFRNVSAIEKLDDIGDVYVSEAGTPNNNDILAWDSTNTRWVAKNVNTVGSAVADPGGLDKQVQFNDGGTLAGAAQLYWDKASNRLGVGTNNPQWPVEISATGIQPIITLRSFNNFSGGLQSFAARGTDSSPQALQQNDLMNFVSAFGYGTSGFSAFNKGFIGINAAENWTDTAQGTYIAFHTTSAGTTTRSEKLRIGSSGSVGIGTTAPQSLLHVAGGIQLGDDTATCPGASNEKLGTLRFNSGALQVCVSGGWSSVGADTLSGLSCATNEIPKWNGSAWACAADGGGSGAGSSAPGPYLRLSYSANSLDRQNVIPFNVAESGGGAAWASNKFTATIPGLYLVTTEGYAYGQYYLGLVIRKNGAGIAAGHGDAGVTNKFGGAGATAVTYLNAGDYIDFYYTHDTPGIFLNTATASIAYVGGGGSGNTVAFRAHKGGTAQSVPSSTSTKLTFSVESFDTNNNFDTATSRFTPTVAGIYAVTGSARCDSSTTYCQVVIMKNGAGVANYYDYHNPPNAVAHVTTLVQMNGTTDYLELNAVSGGAAGNINGADTNTYFEAALMGGSAQDTLSGLSCATNEIPKWNGSAWACAADGGGSGTPTGFYATRTSNLSSNNTVTFDSEAFDSTNSFDAATGAFTAPATGIYQFIWGSLGNQTSDVYRLYLRRNGVAAPVPHSRADSNATGSEYIQSNLTAYLSLTAGDTVSVFYQSDGGNALLSDASRWIYFGGNLVSGGGSDTLSGLSCATNEIPKWNGTAWACAADGGGSGSGGASMIAGWPDAITCNLTSPAWGQRYFYLHYDAGTSVLYRMDEEASGGNVGVWFTKATKTFWQYDTNLNTAAGGTAVSDCTGKTIDQLYASGHAFNFGGGSEAGGSGNPVAFSVRKTATQAVAAASWVKVTWDAEDFDTNNNFDLATERFTPTVAGKYQINLTAYSQDVSSYLHVALYKNGAYYGGNVGSGNNANRGTTVGMVVDMNGSTDYLEAYAYVYGSGTVNIYGASQNWTHFSGFRIGGGRSGTDTLAGLSCAAGEVAEWDGSAWVCGTGSGSGGVNAPPVISFSGGGTTTATLASGMTLYQNNTRNAWGSYPTLPDYLVGTKGTDTVNGTPDGSAVTLSISGGSALCYMLRNSGWAAVPTTNWSLTGDSFGSYDQIYERVFPPGNYTLDSYSAMYACSTSLVGGGGSDTAAGSVAGALQFNDGSDAFAADDLNLVWDDTNNRLGIGTAAPERSLSLTGGNIGFQESAQARSIVWGPAASSQKASIDGSEGASSYLAFATAGAERLRIDSNGGVSIGSGAGANASSLLDLTSTTKGFLPPRMTTAQRDAIATPATGLVIYNTTTNSLDFFNGTVWSSGALTSLPGSKGLSISGTVTSASATTFNVSAVTTNTLLGSNPTTSAITIPEAGNYFMTAVQNTCTGGANGYGSVIIKVNGVTRRSANSLPNSCDSATVGLYAVLAAGDTVAAECGQNNAVSTTCYFDIAKLQSDTALGGGGSSQWTTAGSDIHYGTGGVAVGQAAAPEATAALEIESTTKGFLPPRMTTTQRDAIASPAEGLVVYNTTTKSLDLRVASSWLSFGGGMTGNTMVTGWPDAIACNISTPTNNGVRVLHLAYAPHTSNAYIYRTIENPSERIYMQMAFSAAGAFGSFTYNNGSQLNVTSDCDNKSIATLYSEGKAFNFVGGATASADGTAGQVQFNEGGNLKADAALHWDNTNKRLGIGTATPGAILHILKTGSQANQTISSDTQAQILLSSPNNYLYLHNGTAGADQKYLRISNSGGNTAFYVMKDDLSGVQHTPLFLQHSSGNVGIGTTSPGYKLHAVGGFRLSGSSGGYLWSERSDSEFDFIVPSGSTKRGLSLHASPTGSSGNLMELFGHNGTVYNISMSVTNAGNVGIGTTTPNGKLHVVGNMIVGPANVSSYGDTTHGGVGIQGDGLNGRLFITSGSSYIQEFNWQPTGTRVGSITITGSATSYNTTSDRRLKKNIRPTAKGLDTLLRIDVKDFNFIDDAARGRVQGFIAQDLYEVYPEAVTTNGDDGAGPLENGKGWAVDYGRITPLLVKSIQELKADNDNLRAELKAANDNYMKQLNELRTRMQALERTTMEAR